MVLHGSAILFDIDDTLVDSTPVVERSWRTWAREYDVDAEDVLQVCHGRRTEPRSRSSSPRSIEPSR
jgi:mannitol-1-/sugar-/sorbitol-6-phosphatase